VLALFPAGRKVFTIYVTRETPLRSPDQRNRKMYDCCWAIWKCRIHSALSRALLIRSSGASSLIARERIN